MQLISVPSAGTIDYHGLYKKTDGTEVPVTWTLDLTQTNTEACATFDADVDLSGSADIRYAKVKLAVDADDMQVVFTHKCAAADGSCGCAGAPLSVAFAKKAWTYAGIYPVSDMMDYKDTGGQFKVVLASGTDTAGIAGDYDIAAGSRLINGRFMYAAAGDRCLVWDTTGWAFHAKATIEAHAKNYDPLSSPLLQSLSSSLYTLTPDQSSWANYTVTRSIGNYYVVPTNSYIYKMKYRQDANG
jgi:hypothetical protein